MQLVAVGQPFDRRDLLPVGLDGQHRAGLHRFTVEVKVHAPHDEVSQPMLVPVSPAWSRMKCTSRVRGSTSAVCLAPLTSTVISTGSPFT